MKKLTRMKLINWHRFNNCTIEFGDSTLLSGENGAGKSTLARCICGLEKKCGLLQVDGKTLDWKARLKHCYMVMQDTSHQLFTESVMDEVLLSMDNEDETVADEILEPAY